MESLSGKRIFVGLSGGVDSGVTAALLRKRGANVTGVFIKGWYPPGMPCTWKEERLDAMRVAARLQIPFHTLDAAKEYKQGVIDYLLAEYAAGRTPNPDVMCNREVKFGAFARFAKEQNADYIATGHYARTENGVLYRGADPEKDQSYFLWAVPREIFDMTLFPLGTYRKEDTRKLARSFDLPNADKKDSQGVCFLGSISVEDFLKEELGTEPGVAIDEGGKEIGIHQGAVLYTLGERVAIQGPEPGPWYVAAKNLKENKITVSRSHTPSEFAARITLSYTHTLASIEPKKSYTAQLRYHGPTVPGTISLDWSAFMPSEALPEPAAAGQSLVLYDGERVVGGGIMG